MCATISSGRRKTKNYSHFIGADISKNKLDFAVCEGKTFLFHAETKNENEAILSFIARLKAIPSFKLSKAVFCMENTGFYGNFLLKALVKLKANIVHDHPLKIKKSMSLARGKDDINDAIRIAEYAWKNRDDLKFWRPKRAVISELAGLMTLRNRLLGISMMLKTPQKEKMSFIHAKEHRKNVKACETSIDAITADMLRTEEEIKMVISKDEHLARLMQVITSVPFIGWITGTYILICTNEYKDITDPKKFACYAGIAPFPKESGLTIRKWRTSHMANHKMKSLLHLCAVNAMTRNEELKTYYSRKVKEGKPKRSVINAVRYKLILRVFACLKQDRLFTKNFERHEPIPGGDTTNGGPVTI